MTTERRPVAVEGGRARRPERRATRGDSPPGSVPPTSAVRTEARAPQVAGLAVVVSFVVAFFAFSGRRPALSGDYGVGDVAAIVGGVVAVLVLPVAYRHTYDHPQHHWLAERPAWRRYLGVVALAAAHGAIAYMATWAGFRIFQGTFKGLTLDAFAGGLATAVVGGLAAYATYQSGARMNSYLLSNFLATYLAAGVLTSMVTTMNTNWWEVNFSVLGARDSGMASWTFNMTLITSGIVITMLAEYVTRDIQALAAYREDCPAEERKGSAAIVRTRPILVCLVLIGIFFAGTGLVPVDFYMPAHNSMATAMTGAYTLLVLCLPWWLPGLSRTFHVTGFAMLGGAILAVFLWFPFGYYNMTAMEFFVAGVILAWLVLLIRNVAAALEDARREALGRLLRE
ncbi:hypothetical protein [Sinomonas sp. ASV322]|uniref:hypothetical protein n=1 Tax=Sinomonas sp. ASV322 TaxID=3041920 RepID=UPI0027DEA1F6|nr:hypothetical protein [Sinomonas sp. ASV322]MDQ4501810.1 hypothetical protein [Sinomonas sp. ASV322]